MTGTLVIYTLCFCDLFGAYLSYLSLGLTLTPYPTTIPKQLTNLAHSVYSTQIFDIFIGPSKAHFMAHEAILVQSPLLAHLIEKQDGKKGKLKTTLVLPRESPANFGALLQYLYSHQLVMPSLNGEGSLNCDTDGEEAKAAAKLLAKLYVLVLSILSILSITHTRRIVEGSLGSPRRCGHSC